MNNIINHKFSLTKKDFDKSYNVNSKIIWIFGLSGSGKSTIANEFSQLFLRNNLAPIKILDGDNLRSGLNSDLSFNQKDRHENIRRVSEVAKLFVDSGITTLCTFITPLESHRNLIQSILKEHVIFIYLNTPLSECERRDPKGLYQKARSGQIKNFTGISDTFEVPAPSFYTIETKQKKPNESATELYNLVKNSINLKDL